MSVRIEKISESDYEELYTLFLEFARFQNKETCILNSVEQMKQEKDCINGFVVRNSRNELIGYTTFFYSYYTWTGKSLYMDDLYIKQEYRGMGLGNQLIRKVADFAKDNKCKKVRWQVGKWNTSAIAFYEKLGAKIDSSEMNCDLKI